MQILALCTLALASVAAARPQFQYNQFQPHQQRQAFGPTGQQQQYHQQHQQQQYQQQQQYYSQQPLVYRQEAEAQAAAGATSTTPIPIISYFNEVNPDGSYRYSYETGNGIKADESGRINNAGQENEALAVQGSYSYVGDDGQTYSVQYTADENGFQPQGAHFPTAPPLPAELQKAIDEHLAALATAAPEEESTPDQRYYQQQQQQQHVHQQHVQQHVQQHLAPHQQQHF